ncbi:MAG: hypothetical protein OXI51_13905 [Chloroflexota bacterium]|nr:hypothetical protein [Chloroflexota bacterium]
MPDPLLPLPRRPALRAYQARVLRGLLRAIAARPSAPLTVLMPRQSGKNEIAAALVACLLRTNAHEGGTVVVCAPTLDPQARISADRIRAALAATDPLVPAAGHSRSRGDSVAVGRARAVLLSANPQASVAGHTASIALIADEAQDIDEAWFNRQFRPMAASTGAPTVLFGTAWNGRTLLERAVEANRALDAATPHGPRRHHQAPWREVAAVLPAYGAYVESERERLGATHPLFLSQYELVPGEVAGRLLTRDLLAALEGGHEPLSTPDPGERYVAGLDFGGEGEDADATVLTIARVEASAGNGGVACRVVAQREWRGAPYARVLDGVRALDRLWRFERVSADATGLGAPLVAQLRPQLGARLDEVVFTAASKSALGYALLAAARTGRLALPRDDGSPEAFRCREELAACEASLASGGRLAWGNDRGHDDYVVSLALCLRAAESAGAPRVAVGRGRS